LTCRTHYFRTDRLAEEQIGRGLRARETELFVEQKGRTNFEIIHLQEFTQSQIETFLSRHYEGDEVQVKKTLATMHATYNLWDLAKRPVLLEMILKVFPRLTQKLKKAIVTPAELYEEYVSDWFAYVAKGNEEILDRATKCRFCEDLAKWMFMQNRELLPYAELETLVHDYFSGRPAEAYAALDVEVRTCSFLKRDTEGNYQFVHRSFMEFFAAHVIANDLRKQTYSLFGASVLTFEIRNFLRGLIGKTEVYWDAIRSTRRKVGGGETWTGANAVAMLRSIGEDLRRRNFDGADLTRVDLSYLDIEGASFRDSCLCRAVLTNAQLIDTDFRGADLTEIEIEERQTISMLLWGGHTLTAAGSDGSARVYSDTTWELKQVLRGHASRIEYMFWSPSEEFLFTASSGELVAWTNDFEQFASFKKQDGEAVVGPIRVRSDGTSWQIDVHRWEKRVLFSDFILERDVEELEVSVRTYNVLKRGNIHKVRQIIRRSEVDYLKIKNSGKKSINELKDILAQIGLSLGMRRPTTIDIEGQCDVVQNDDIVDLTLLNEGARFHMQFPVPGDSVLAASYSEERRLVALGTSSGRVLIYRVQDGSEVAILAQGRVDCTGMKIDRAQGLDKAPAGSATPLGKWLQERGALYEMAKSRR